MSSAFLVHQLTEAGTPIVSGDTHNITYRVGANAVTAQIITAGHIGSTAALRTRIRRATGRVIVTCRSISDQARATLLADGDVDLCVEETGELVLAGTTYREPRMPPEAVRPTATDMRRLAAERMCILADGPLYQREIADVLQISQQAVSQMSRHHPLPPTPLSAEARRQRLTAARAHLGEDLETYWYGLDPASAQASSVLDLAAGLTVPAFAGGEVAADVLCPWRVPAHGLIYATELLDLTDADLVPATAETATLTLRVPVDQTIAATARWWSTEHPAEPATADPVVVLQDLLAFGDPDDGAPARLRDWIADR